MKNYLKIMSLAAFVLASITASAQTPVYGYQSLAISSTGLTNQLGLGTTFWYGTNGLTLGNLKYQNIAISSTIYPPTTVGATNIYCFASSLDGNNWDTNAADYIKYTNATSLIAQPQTVVSKINIGAIGYLRLQEVDCYTPAAGTFVTNLNLGYAVKINSP